MPSSRISKVKGFSIAKTKEEVDSVEKYPILMGNYSTPEKSEQ